MVVINQLFNDYGYYLQTVNKNEDLHRVDACDFNDKDMFIINGIANDCFLAADKDVSKCEGKCAGTYMNDKKVDCKKKSCKWKRPYTPETEGDTPRANPHNWQHVVAVKNGKLCGKHAHWSLKWLHLDDFVTGRNGKRLYPTGFFYRIDKVYMVKKR